MENQIYRLTPPQNRVNELASRVATLNRAIQQKDSMIYSLRRRIKSLESELDEKLRGGKKLKVNIYESQAIARAMHAIREGYSSDFTEAWLKTRNRKREIVISRQIMAYLLRLSGMTWKKIGQVNGGKDHSTSMANYRVIEDLIDTDRAFRETMKKIIELFNR